jgi:hypothetical protein
MTPDEVAVVLSKASAFDQRTIGEADVMAWHEVLADIPVDDALQAVTDHYRENATRLWPADLRRLATQIDHKRRGAIRRAELAAAQEPRALPAGPADPERVSKLIGEVVAALPVTDSDRIRERAKHRAHKERGRPEPDKRKQKKRLTGKEQWPPPQTDDIAAFATRYLLDGYPPADVSDRLRVSKRWCEKTARKFRSEGTDPP